MNLTKPMLFIPGWGMGIQVWLPLTELLQEENILFFDHSQCRHPEDYLQNGLAFLEAENLRDVTLVGWSMGTLLALELALAAPERVAGLILSGGTSCFTAKGNYSSGWPAAVVKRMQSNLQRQPEKTLHQFYMSMFSAGEGSAGRPEQFLSLAEKFGDFQVSTLQAGLEYLLQTDLRDRLAQVFQPALLIHGREDSICPLDASSYMKQRLSNSTLHVWAGCGHLPFFTRPEETVTLIKDFLYRRDEEGLV